MSDKKRCTRCLGQKFMYAFGSGYSSVNFGGKKVDCPMCNGEGTIKTLENASEEVKEAVKALKEKSSKKRAVEAQE